MTTRLTPADHLNRSLREADFQRQVTDLAELLGWGWAHWRPARTAKGWRTPVEGPLGAGWPDLTLVRVRDRRLIFAELKRETEKVTAEQAAVLAALGELAGHWFNVDGVRGLEVRAYLWRPSDFPRIAEILR